MHFSILVVIVMLGAVVPSVFAEISITDDSTGGDCTTIGTWDSVSKTCILTSDVSDNIVINSDGIILDGNEHTINVDLLVSNDPVITSLTHNNVIITNFKISCTPGGGGSAFPSNSHNCGRSGIVSSGENIVISNNHITNLLYNYIILNYGEPYDNLSSEGEIYGNILEKPDWDLNSHWSTAINAQLTKGVRIHDNVIDHFGMGISVCGDSKIFENTFKNNHMVIDKLIQVDICGQGEDSALFYNNNFFNNNNISDSDGQQIRFHTDSSESANYVGSAVVSSIIPESENIGAEIDFSCNDSNYDNL